MFEASLFFDFFYEQTVRPTKEAPRRTGVRGRIESPRPAWNPKFASIDSLAATSRVDATRRDANDESAAIYKKSKISLARARTHRVARDVEGDPTARSNESQDVRFILKIERVRARGRFRLFGGITHRDDARSRSGILRHRSSRSVAFVRSLVDARREVTPTRFLFARNSQFTIHFFVPVGTPLTPSPPPTHES